MNKFKIKAFETIYFDIKNNKLSDNQIKKLSELVLGKLLTQARLNKILAEAQLIRENKVSLEDFLRLVDSYAHKYTR